MDRMSVYEQSHHDQIVAGRVKQLSMFYRVNASLDCVKGAFIYDGYPDIIVMDEKNNVLFIEEVEPENSVTKKAKNERWMKFSKLGYSFNLIVPESKLLKAKQLIKNLSVNKLIHYQLTKIDIRFRQVSTLNIYSGKMLK